MMGNKFLNMGCLVHPCLPIRDAIGDQAMQEKQGFKIRYQELH